MLWNGLGNIIVHKRLQKVKAGVHANAVQKNSKPFKKIPSILRFDECVHTVKSNVDGFV